MYNDLKDKGFEVLAFPANAFYNQESGTNEEICAFVKKNYGSTFTMFQKIDINGPNTHPVYIYLRRNSEMFNKEKNASKMIPLNFAKFLLNKNGQVVKFFDPLEDM